MHIRARCSPVSYWKLLTGVIHGLNCVSPMMRTQRRAGTVASAGSMLFHSAVV